MFFSLKSNVKRNIVIALIVVGVISAIVLNFTRAKYRTTESIPLIQGTINFSPSDLNLMAVYLNKNGDTISSDKVPHVGYTLNTEQSICEVNDVEDLETEIVYENGYLYVNKLSHKGTKCTAYFDLIPDSQAPTVTITLSSTDTSITVTANATDNVGVYYYYYKLDNGEEVRSEEAIYTFEGLTKDNTHTVTVRVEDAAGNVASDSGEITVGLKAGDVILAASKPQGQTTDWTSNGTGITYYYEGDTNEVNNWVQFAGFWWRIIRINGDGSIRMIYAGTNNASTSDDTLGKSAFNSSYNNNMYVGFKYTKNDPHGTGTNSTILGSSSNSSLNTWYSNNLVSYADKIDGNAGFCGDRRVTSGSRTGTSSTDYQPSTRVDNNSPSLTCQTEDIYTTTNSSTGNKSLTYPIGLLTADEYVLAGSGNSYLNIGKAYWTMSPCSFNGSLAYVFVVRSDGDFSGSSVNSTSHNVRPVINIRSDVQLTGEGTTTDPFKVVGAS